MSTVPQASLVIRDLWLLFAVNHSPRQASGIIDKGRENKDMILYRPVGLQELVLIYDSGMKASRPPAPTTDLLSGSSTGICQPEAVIRKKNSP